MTDRYQLPLKKKVTRVTVAQLNQMLAYCAWVKVDGTYYGSKAQFNERHLRIVAWLEAVRENKMRRV